jgi:hypothetical protein
MKAKLALAALITAGAAAFAQRPAADNSVTFGNHLTVGAIAGALQSAGYQALVQPIVPLAAQAGVLGMISSGANGAKILLFVSKCPNSKTEQICSATFYAILADDQNLLTDANIVNAGGRTNIAKVVKATPPNGPAGFGISYTYICKDFEDARFVNNVMVSFAADVSLVAAAYKAGFPALAPTPAPK